MNLKSLLSIFLFAVLGFSLFQPNLHMLTHHHEHEEEHVCADDHSDESATICHHELECELCSHFAQQVTFTFPSGTISLDYSIEKVNSTQYTNPSGVAHILLPPTRGSPLRI